MKRKSLIPVMLMAIASLLFTSIATAQQASPQRGQGQGQGQRRSITEEEVKEHSAKLSEQLKATDEQAKKLEAIDLEFYKKMQSQRENANGDREAMRNAMQTLNKERDEKYTKVLTAEQLKVYKKIREEQKQQRQNRENGQEGKPGGTADEQRTRGRN